MNRCAVGALCLCISLCLGKENAGSEFLVAEAPVKKRSAVSMQSVGTVMATTLTNGAQCIEKVSKLQQKLIALLSDMVDNGRKSTIGQQANAERAQLRVQLSELSSRFSALITAIDDCMQTGHGNKKAV